jgi:opacity protein-like surface antigen
MRAVFRAGGLGVGAIALAATFASAGVLPEDRADILYHRYDGGGVTIDGPSVLVRKSFLDKFSASANYYVDMVSSASIDVVSSASPYSEKRTQKSLSLDYLRGKSTYSIGYIDSTESDYVAKTAFLNISQDMFGDLTTISFGFRRGQNDVFRNVKNATTGARERDPTFAREVESRGYTGSISQVLTRNLIGTVNFDLTTDEGYLNSPYRSIRFADATAPMGFRLAPEVYPSTRTSNATALRLKYFLPWRAALDGQYRFYTDTWGVRSNTLRLGYTHPLWKNWVFDGSYRYYQQDAADFYRDLFPRQNTLNFQARDKELSTFKSHSIGVGASYEFKVRRAPWLTKATVNVNFDHLMIDYEDFRDVTLGPAAGAEPLYGLDANIIQVFVSAWF